jgi:hypothetical protein
MTDESSGERFCSSIRWFVSAPHMRQRTVNAERELLLVELQELLLALAQ